MRGRWERFERRIKHRHPIIVERSLQLKGSLTGHNSSDAVAFLSAMRRADLLVVSGAGVLTDAFPENAHGILSTLDMAIARGIPTAMFGQGIGPIADAELRSHAAAVLPRVDLIGIRERLASLSLLTSLGVDAARIVVTGDDAIELAMPAAAADVETGPPARPKIGLNVRVASYSDVGPEHLAGVREAVATASRAHRAEVAPIPIAHRERLDVSALRELLSGLAVDDSDGGASLFTPALVIERVRECRVVVTGSYHAAVFALAQGIPAVALANSPYYHQKMSGLADQFGGGCDIVAMEPASSLAGRLVAAIDGAWTTGDRDRRRSSPAPRNR